MSLISVSFLTQNPRKSLKTLYSGQSIECLQRHKIFKGFPRLAHRNPRNFFRRKKMEFPLSHIPLFPIVLNVKSTSGLFPTNKTPVKVNCHIIVIFMLFFLLAIVKQAIKLSKQEKYVSPFLLCSWCNSFFMIREILTSVF